MVPPRPLRPRPPEAAVREPDGFRQLVLTLVAVVLAQAADGITFLRMVADHGLAVERNPLVAHLAAASAPWVLLVLKALLVAEILSIAVLVARRHPWGSAVIVTIAVAAGLLGAFSNLAVLAAR